MSTRLGTRMRSSPTRRTVAALSIRSIWPRSSPTRTGLSHREVSARVSGGAQRAGDLARAQAERERDSGGDGDQADSEDEQDWAGRDSHLQCGGQAEEHDDHGLGDRSDRDREVHLDRRALDALTRKATGDHADQHEGERDQQPGNEQNGLVERLAEEPEPKQRKRGEEDNHDDAQPDGTTDEPRQGVSQLRPLQHGGQTDARRGAVDAEANQRAPDDPA